MSASNPDRPLYFEGQTLGAADLTAAIDYARDLSRLAALGPHVFGVQAGCEVVAVNEAGAVQYYVTPGVATDLYGRTIVVATPSPVPAARLSRLASGIYPVWLRFEARAWQGKRAAFEGCHDADEAYGRLREGFAIEVGAKLQPKDRSAGLVIAGAPLEDPRLFLRAIDAAAGIVLDESAPHQFFPQDKAVSLVPVGAVVWEAGAPGRFVEPDEPTMRLSRTLRRNIGVVAEQVLAADGVIRLMDRRFEPAAGQSLDDLAAKAAIQVDDLTARGTRFVGNELVWIEGHTRARGDVRLWGTRLELRDLLGAEANAAPLWLRRHTSATNAANGEDLQIAIGAAPDGANRLTVGPFDAANADLDPRFIVDSKGRAGIGPGLPGNLDNTSLLVTSDDETRVAIASPAQKSSRLVFTQVPPTNTDGRIEYEKAERKLHFGHGGDPALNQPNWMTLTDAGQLGIRTKRPENYSPTGNDLVVVNKFHSGITIKAHRELTSNLLFASGSNTDQERRGGWVTYDHRSSSLEFGTANATRITVTDTGRVGIGITAPPAMLTLADAASGKTLQLDPDRVAARTGGAASDLDLQPAGGALTVHADRGEAERVVVDIAGRVGIGMAAPDARLHLRAANPELRIDTNQGVGSPRLALHEDGGQRLALSWERADDRGYLWSGAQRSLTFEGRDVGIGIGAQTPVARLHVAASVSGSAADLDSHVAVFENTSASANADVMALRVAAGGAGTGNNFLTFFAGNTAIGAIQATGAAPDKVMLKTSGADFAECLARAPGEPVIGPARVIGLKGGAVSLVTRDADAVFVTSEAPAVLGNWQSDRAGFEQIALVGQAPVLVDGPVSVGDLIEPSGRDDGIGRRLDEAAAGLTPMIVGRALTALAAATRGTVTVAVGLHAHDAARLVARAVRTQADEIAALRAELARLTASLERGDG
jgi:hypothetical protein